MSSQFHAHDLVEQLSQQEIDLACLRDISRDKPILFDARKIVDGGIGVYSQNIIETLVEREIAVALLGDRDLISQFPWARSVSVLNEHSRRYSFDEMILMPRRIPFARFSLFHVPHYTLPFAVPIPTLVTIHDLIHITNPQTFYHRPVSSMIIASTLRRASAVTAVSQATRDSIEERFPAVRGLSNRLSVARNQLPGWCHGIRLRATRRSSVFFANISQAKPHKGATDLLQAFSAANQRHKHAYTLVIAGFAAQALAENIQYRALLSRRDDIEFLGRLSTQELSECYQTARFVVVPSVAEGFGLMMLEAHAHGTPVVYRPVPALAEISTPLDICAQGLSQEHLVAALDCAMQCGDVLGCEVSHELQNSTLPFSRDRSSNAVVAGYLRTLGRL